MHAFFRWVKIAIKIKLKQLVEGNWGIEGGWDVLIQLKMNGLNFKKFNLY
jgi:hypothetical protein